VYVINQALSGPSAAEPAGVPVQGNAAATGPEPEHQVQPRSEEVARAVITQLLVNAGELGGQLLDSPSRITIDGVGISVGTDHLWTTKEASENLPIKSRPSTRIR
jgi:hypothetical protein